MADVLRFAGIWAMVISLSLAATGCHPKTGFAFRQLQYPVATRYLDVDGVEVAYSEMGEGEPALLLIHGLGSYLPVWSRNLAALSRQHRVVAIDLPGYGRSSKANYRYSMRFFAQVVQAVIERLHLEHVVLVGHSMGGQIAMTHALRYPGRAEALVLVAPAGFEKFEPGEGGWLGDAVSKEFVMLTPLDGIHANLASNFSRMDSSAQFMADDRVRIIGGPDFDAYAYAVSRSVYAMIHEPVLDRLPEIRVPVLVTFGADDALIPNPILHGGDTRKLAEKAVSKMPCAQLFMIPRAGHMVQFEQPRIWNQAVLEFLAKEEAP
jgi:pimeloyl-ACP methyl ester carboxylesterase